VRRDSGAAVRAGWRWGRSLGCRPMWATAAVKLGGRRCGPASSSALVARRPSEEWRRARPLSGLAGKGEELSFRGCIRRPMGHPPGPTTCIAVRGAPPVRKKVVSGRQTQRQGDLAPCQFQRIARRGACGKTWVGPQNRRRSKNGRRHGATTCVCCLSTDEGRGDEPLVGLAVRLRALGAEVRVCAARLVGGRQREMRTCRTTGSTLRETPVIRPASAGQQSTAASEVSR
jgi:hypothetical protein